MRKPIFVRILVLVLAAFLVFGAAAAALNYDLSGDGKTNVWDLQTAKNQEKTPEEFEGTLREALNGGDELRKNAEGQWEIPYIAA